MNAYDTTLAQNLTTIAVAGLAVMMAYIALSARRYQSYGREALLCAASFLGCQAVVRTMSINDWITADTARLLVGAAALTALVILIQIAWLRYIDTKFQRESVRPPS